MMIDVATLWNSVCTMLQRVEEQKHVIRSAEMNEELFIPTEVKV